MAGADEQLLVVPSNPTPNGDLHVGHLAGPFVGADVLRRAALRRGGSAALVLGTAWQEPHVLLAARRQGLRWRDLVAEEAARIEDALAQARVIPDVMLALGDAPEVARVTRLAFRRLRAKGLVVVADKPSHFCGPCGDWRVGGFVGGSCPHCGSEDASAIDCEGCGRFHDEPQLLHARCSVCGTPTILRPLRRALLRLEPLRSWLARSLSTIVLGAPVRSFAEETLARPLPDIAVTAPGQGVDVPDPAFAGQRLYPAFELAGRYVVMTRRLRATGRFEPEEATDTALLFGLDNAFERVILFPAVLWALADQRAPLPTVMQMTFFYLFEGAKFSTSRQHFVLARDLIAEAGADAVRLYVAATRPEHERTDFSRGAFANSHELRVVGALARWAETRDPPDSLGPPVESAQAGWSELAGAVATLREALRPATFSCRTAARCVVEIARIASAAAARGSSPDGMGWSELATTARDALVADCEPLIPETARNLEAALGARRDGASERLARLAASHARGRSATV